MERKIAVLLRGPKGIGKSTIAKHVLRELGLPKNGLVDLDAGWGHLKEDSWRRVNTGRERYPELVNRDEPVLLLELNWGEDATLNPTEWLNILAEEDRVVHAIRLRAPLATCESRAMEEGKIVVPNDFFLRTPEDRRWLDFPKRADLAEYEIDNERVSAEETATKLVKLIAEL